MTVTLLVVLIAIVLALALVGVLPVYSSRRGGGYYPADIVAIVVATAAIAALI
jgi:hypothetical protein